MSLDSILRAVAGVLALSAGLAFTPVGAQTTTTNDLVTTDCGAGQVTECGRKTIQSACTFSISFQPSPTSVWGFSLSIGSCTSQGYMTIYKDFRRLSSSGSCITTQKFPADATSTGSTTGPGDEPLADGATYESGTC